MPTRLTVELVPSTCWYTNVRSNEPKAVRDRLRCRLAAAGRRQTRSNRHQIVVATENLRAG